MKNSGLMAEIAQTAYLDLQKRREQVVESHLVSNLPNTRRPGGFIDALHRSKERFPIIAEIKRASPSKALRTEEALDPVEVARSYIQAGASALSVLTEPHYFQGSPDDLRAIREYFPSIPLLKKDFLLDRYQLLEARHEGADAVLLIYALLGGERLKELMQEAHELELTPLIEVHDEEELLRSVELGAKLIGINNRNLNTLEVSLDTSRQLASFKPEKCTFISESGLCRYKELEEFKQLGFDAFLIGSSFMAAKHPGEALSHLLKEGQT